MFLVCVTTHVTQVGGKQDKGGIQQRGALLLALLNLAFCSMTK